LKRMVADQEKSIAEEERKAERDKIIGDTIYAHFNELQGFVNLLFESKLAGARLEHHHCSGYGG